MIDSPLLTRFQTGWQLEEWDIGHYEAKGFLERSCVKWSLSLRYTCPLLRKYGTDVMEGCFFDDYPLHAPPYLSIAIVGDFVFELPYLVLSWRILSKPLPIQSME